MATCHNICKRVDQADNDINLIIELAKRRNLTYSKKITGERYRARNNVRHSIRYTARCTICDYNYSTYTGLECPCCGQRVSTRIRDKYWNEPKPIIRSHVDYIMVKN